MPNGFGLKSVRFHLSHPILRLPDFSLPFHLYTDASGFAIAGILGKIVNEQPVVISYWDRTLTKPEQAYRN